MITLKLTHNKEQWDEFILEHGGHPLQLWGWGEVKDLHGWDADRMLLRRESEDHEHDEVIGAVQVLTRPLPWPFRSLAYVPRGPIVAPENREELLRLLADYINRVRHSVALTIEPDALEYSLPKEWHKAKHHILPSETLILDLNKTEAELLNDMAKKTRQYIRKSAAEKIKIVSIKTKDDLEKCLAIYHETAKRARFDIHDDEYYYDVFRSMGENNQIFAAYFDGEPIAFLWIAISAETAFELYGGMNDRGHELRANYALKWHAIRKCKNWGIERYDFGGLIDGGVSTFKMGWSSEKTHLAGTFDFPLSNAYSLWNGWLPAGKKITRNLKKVFKK